MLSFQASIDYARALADVAWSNPTNRLPLLLGAAAVLLLLFWRPGKQRTQQRQDARRDVSIVKRPTNSALWRRLWWKIHRPHDVMRVDGLEIERTGNRSHCLWLGPTGGGKSASVATVRVNGERPTLIVTPDLSDPMIASTPVLKGFRWTAGGSVAVDFLKGSPADVAERLTEVFRSGGTGAWKMTARRITTLVIEALDASGERRTLLRIAELLRDAVAGDKELRTVCAGWVERFLSTAQIFGDSIAAGGVDVADLLAAGETVLLDNDAFAHPSLVGDVVAFGLAEAKRCATLCPDGFRLIFEEAGQLGDRIDLADPFFRAGRRRKIAVDALTQGESDLNDAISQNAGTRVYFSQELKSLQKIAADRLGMDYTDLDPARMRDFTAWVASRGIRRLVKFPKPLKVTLSAADTFSSPVTDVENGRGVRTRLERLEPHQALPALPAPSGYSEFMKLVYLEGECERWSGKHDRAGHVSGCKDGCQTKHVHKVGCGLDCQDRLHLDNCYGLVWWPLPEPRWDQKNQRWIVSEWQRVHRVRYRLAYGSIPNDENGKPMTIDHRRTCPKDCSKLEHLNGACSVGENVKRSFRVGRENGKARATA